nr:MAG TPA: hypothetical protein [Inoviridae sp.]
MLVLSGRAREGELVSMLALVQLLCRTRIDKAGLDGRV